MTISMHPQALAMLEAIKASGEPPLETLSAAEARRLADERVVRTNGPPEPVEAVDTLEPSDAGVPRLRLYHPGGGPLPVLLFLHGGGWTVGNLETHDPQCRYLANRVRCLVVAVEYRLAPEHRFPAAYEDCWAALRWVADHAATYGGDPGRIAVAGDSSGGGLAVSLCIAARDAGGPSLVGQALIYPALDLGMATDSYRRLADGYFLTAAKMRWFVNNYLSDPMQAEDIRASPLRAASLAGLPPALVIITDLDPLCDDGRAYAARLKEDGVEVDLVEYTGWPHGFFFWSGTDAAADGLARVETALIRAFETTPKPL